MKFKTTVLISFILTVLISSGLVHPLSATPEPTATAQEIQFICGASFAQNDSGTGSKVPTTIAWTSKGKVAIIQWVKNLGNYTPQQRCEAVSPNFQKAYEEGTIKYLTTGIENGRKVVCFAREVRGECVTTLMTLRPGDNPNEFLVELRDALNGRSAGSAQHSSSETRVVYEVDLDNLLKKDPIAGQ